MAVCIHCFNVKPIRKNNIYFYVKIIHLFLKKYNTFILFIIKRYIKKNINFNIKKEKILLIKLKVVALA